MTWIDPILLAQWMVKHTLVWQRLLDEGKFRSITDIAAAEGIDVTQARRLLRLTLLAPAVVGNLLANPDVAINLESVLCRVMPLDWR